MSDTETEQQEIQARVQEIFACNTLPISDASEMSADSELSLTNTYNSNLYFAPQSRDINSSVESSYSETDQFGVGGGAAPIQVQGSILTPDEVGSRIHSAAHKYRERPSNPINTMESGHVARKVELFQEAYNMSRGGCSDSSKLESPRETHVSQLRAKFDLAPSTSPLPRKFSHPNPLMQHIVVTPIRPPRANLATAYTADNTDNASAGSPVLPKSILRRSKSASPDLPSYSSFQTNHELYQQYPPGQMVGSRGRSTSPKPRPRTRTAEIIPSPAPRTEIEQLYARPDTSHKRKRTLSCSSPKHTPPKRPSLSHNSETIPGSIHTTTSPGNYSIRRVSMSPELAISKQLMRTVRRSMSPEDLRQLEAQYGQEEEDNKTGPLVPSAPPQNPAPYNRNHSFKTAVYPGKNPTPLLTPTPTPISSVSPVHTPIGFPHRIPRRSVTSVSLHTPKTIDDDIAPIEDTVRQASNSLTSQIVGCNSQSSIDTLSTDVSSISSAIPTHCLTFSSGYNIQPIPPPATFPGPEQRVMTRSATRGSLNLKDKLGTLRNQICLLEDGWRQATSALQICQMHGGLSGSNEEVEAERLLLNCSLRREAFFQEAKLLESGYGLESSNSCTASLTLSGIKLSLSQQFMEHLTTRTGLKLSYHFVCVIKSTNPAQVVATHPLSPQPSVLNPNYNQLTFSDTLVFHCVKEGFQLTPMVYMFEANRGKEETNASLVKTPVSKVKRILNAAKSGSPLKRQKSKKFKRKLPIVTSEMEIELKKTRFTLIASTSLDKRYLKRTDFRLEPHSCPVYPYPLVPLLRLSLSVTPDLEQQEIVKGFLTIFHDDLTWNRRWCVLAHTTLSFWLYPEEEEQDKPPVGTISLQYISGEIESTNRIQCARINTFYFHSGRTRSKKYLISADSKQEKEKWMTAIKQVKSNVQAWV
ncbi:Actin-binding protein anillin [Oopsacas minuta]|uniref:Actin-binding protein anillin n=1 Tax=Oopsacas minuta TaxID=111878 RepID=A0AAV7JIF3_9METZ|nr:Actin-binding protein anillin [Oopsacas minuta]